MDIKKLTQEVLLKNMTPEQQLAVLDSVTASVKEAKAVQKQKIAENVDLVLQALKRIEADMLKRVQDSASKVETRVNSIKDGKDGKDGTHGAKGEKGDRGLDGKNGLDGRNGKDGKDGIDGVDGVSVVDAHIDFDGSLIIALSNGRELNVGEVLPMDVAEKIKVIGNGGGTSQYVLDAIADLQYQIDNFTGGGGLSYQGTWNASTNSPTITSSVGTNGQYYVVGTAGSTNINGVTDWQVGDWVIFNGSTWQKIDQTNSVVSVNGQTGAVVIGAVPTGGTAGQILSKIDGTDYNSQWIDNYATQLKFQAKNTTGSTLNKGTVVYVSGGAGANPYMSAAKADSDLTSATTVGILESTVVNNGFGLVVESGTISGIDTSAASDGDPVWLSGSTAGGMLFGLANKPHAPVHLVYLGTVTRAHAVNGEIQVKVNNGWELDELHNVSAVSPSNGQTIIWNASTSLWEAHNVSAGTGISVSNGAGSITISNSAPDQTVAITAGTGISSTGTYPNFTITNTAPDQTVSLTGAGTTSITGTYPNFTVTSTAEVPSQTGNAGKFLKTDGTTASWQTLPSVLSILTHSATSVSIAVGNGLLPVLNHAGSTINVAVS